MRSLINWLVKQCSALHSWLKTEWESFVNRKCLFLITLGTILAVIFFGLIEWILNDYPINKVCIETSDDTLLTISISLKLKLILTGILSIFTTYLIDRLRHHIRTKNHFHYSHRIVKKRIVEIYSKKAVLKGYLSMNKDIDRIIKSPLEYVAETLEGNLAPHFSPDCHGFNEMYDDNVKLIVAVTAENPNLWLDPTICFYLINCCAVSLLKKKGVGARDLKIGDFRNSLFYNDHIRQQLDALNCLTTQNWENALSDFDFFRFFLYDGQQRVCLANTVFPSLKASHDLFQMKSYFNQREEIERILETQNKLGDFYAHIDFLWDEISKQSLSDDFLRIINKRKKDHLPEFLFLFKKNDDTDIHSVTAHTFIDGIPYFVEYRESDIGNNGYQKVQSLISYIAQSVQDIGINGQCVPAGRYLNNEKSYLEWV
jgi:hypothetical protein